MFGSDPQRTLDVWPHDLDDCESYRELPLELLCWLTVQAEELLP